MRVYLGLVVGFHTYTVGEYLPVHDIQVSKYVTQVIDEVQWKQVGYHVGHVGVKVDGPGSVAHDSIIRRATSKVWVWLERISLACSSRSGMAHRITCLHFCLDRARVDESHGEVV